MALVTLPGLVLRRSGVLGESGRRGHRAGQRRQPDARPVPVFLRQQEQALQVLRRGRPALVTCCLAAPHLNRLPCNTPLAC